MPAAAKPATWPGSSPWSPPARRQRRMRRARRRSPPGRRAAGGPTTAPSSRRPAASSSVDSPPSRTTGPAASASARGRPPIDTIGKPAAATAGGHLASPGEHQGGHRDATWRNPGRRDGALAWAAERLAEHGRASAASPSSRTCTPWSTAIRLPSTAARLAEVGRPGVGARSRRSPRAGAVGARARAGAAGRRPATPAAAAARRRPDAARSRRRGIRRGMGGDARGTTRGCRSSWSPRADAMVALGVPDTRPDRLPGLVADLLADDDALLARAARRDDAGGAGADRADWAATRTACRAPGRRRRSRPRCSTTTCTTRTSSSAATGTGSSTGATRRVAPFVSLLVTLRVARAGARRAERAPACCSASATPTSTSGATREARRAAGAVRPRPADRPPAAGAHLAPDPARRAPGRARGVGRNAVPGWTAEHLEPGTLTAAAPRT